MSNSKNELIINYNYPDKETDRELSQLEKALAYVYKDAWRGISSKEKEFFAKMQEKEDELWKQIEEGKITIPNGKSPEEYMKAWKQNQINLDDRWLALKKQMAERMTNTNVVASSMINDKTPQIYSLNHNYSAYQMERQTGVSFTLVDEQTVKELVSETNHTDFKVKARLQDESQDGYTYRFLQVNRPLDYSWNEQKIQEKLTAGILQGKSSMGIASSFMEVMQHNFKAAVRNARTAITSAQNSGRQKSYEQAEQMGIQIEKEWMATLDNRTRDSHAELDGERVPYDEKFSNGLMYPGDTSGAPGEVYNCRCTMRAITKYNKSRDVDRIVENDKYANGVTYTGKDGTKSYEDYVAAKMGSKINDDYEDAKYNIYEAFMIEHKASNSHGFVHENVTYEYQNNAKPGYGNVVYQDEYNLSDKNHKDDIDTANWIIKTYGGNVVLVAEQQNVKTQDSIWNDKKWEFKNVSSANSVDKQLKKAYKQLVNSPGNEAVGGIVLKLSDSYNEEQAIIDISEKNPRRAMCDADIIVEKNGKVIAVLRYKKG